MASIKAIEAKSVHQIQSGQVIVDLCSVVKELVENSLDAEATNIEVRFKNHGLDLIEVQDNGAGISPSNYASVALKHHTSKLSTFNDLATLDTFGFRGEAISSLCALSKFSITTAQASEVPKGTRLDFAVSGALEKNTTVAAQKGTTATVENLFEKLPVRRKELGKNIKREYGKVLSLLHAYACVGVNVKFTVKNAMPKAKSMVVFSTKGNPTTKDNIANVYGAKTLQALVALELELQFEPSRTQLASAGAHTPEVIVRGHISRPVFGEGRQTPDRQMFFVNGRPCGLPQIAKAINEVYKSFNVSQSPFIFADFVMDTNSYDVNVSPDKRTILLHNAADLVERLKTCLIEMFEKEEQTVPQSQFRSTKLPAFKQLSVQRHHSIDTVSSKDAPGPPDPAASRLTDDDAALVSIHDDDEAPGRHLHHHFRDQASTRDEDQDHSAQEKREAKLQKSREKQAEKIAKAVAEQEQRRQDVDEYDDVGEEVLEATQTETEASSDSPHAIRVRDFNARMAEHHAGKISTSNEVPSEPSIAVTTPTTEEHSRGVVQNAFDRMRPKRVPAQLATIEIDGETTTHVIGSQISNFNSRKVSQLLNDVPSAQDQLPALSRFSQGLQKFGASGAVEPVAHDLARVGNDITDSESDNEARHEDITNSPRSTTSHVSHSGRFMSTNTQGADEGTSNTFDEGQGENTESDDDYIDEEEKKAQEDARVAELIQAAEESASMPSKENLQRANRALKGSSAKDSTTSLLATIELSMQQLRTQMEAMQQVLAESAEDRTEVAQDEAMAHDEETRLSLTVSKSDFDNMEIAGQFNLGFILATRRAGTTNTRTGHARDELFIIDQHASDEKFNFERLQAATMVGNQRMVKPVTLNLTAVEEEIVLENTIALEKNGFIVDIDTLGNSPVGRRVTLLTLPLSKEVVFDTRDLDELIHLLSETPMIGPNSAPPRPSRVRKMFAMRACRSSIMIGKTLSRRQMNNVVSNMGTMEKPWNCPHGRPTMRHLTSLNDNEGWTEDGRSMGELWRNYLAS